MTNDLPFYEWMIEARKQAQIIWGYESLPDDNPEDAAAAHAQGATPEEYILDIGEDLELSKMTKYWLGSYGI
jgi:hypothetical protein